VGFDIVELAPIPGQFASDFLAARLTYRMMGLALASVSSGALRTA
jgi:N1-aminopropylagmatine ureohydrolase